MKVGIIGGTGYGGIELIRLLVHHPHVQLKSIYSTSQFGKEISSIYPHLSNIVTHQLEQFDVELISNDIELVFFATPSGISTQYIPSLIEKGITCIDLSGDFRLKDRSLYEKWYKHAAPPLTYLSQAAYGLSEINEESVKEATLVANPGCYPTATLLALVPLMKHKWINPNTIVIDGKSGVSGAGRTASLGTHYAEVNENVKAYKLGNHQHIPEIEQTLSTVGEQEVKITFSTHLIPMTRGIMCTIYANFLDQKSTVEVIEMFRGFYEKHPFIRIRNEGTWPATKEVYGSNYCDLGFQVDERTGRLIIVSVIDNVVKGAAGQAVQNMNIIGGWEITSGLSFSPVYP